MVRSLHIILIVLGSVFFKFSFFNAALLTSSSIIEQVSNQSVFKIGKKRRRTIAAFSKNPAMTLDEDVLIGEKEDEEKTKKLFRRLGFPSFNFLIAVVRSHVSLITQDLSGKPDFLGHLFPTHVKNHLSVSILRI